MILQALHQLYGRLSEDPANGLPKPGFSLQGISFKVVLHPDGRLHEIASVKDDNGRSVQTLVPGGAKPSGQGLNPCFLWDNTGYMLGYKPPEDPKPERTQKTFEAFQQKHLALEKTIQNPAFSAVCRFLESWQPDKAGENTTLAQTKTGFGIFQIIGQPCFVHQEASIKLWWEKQSAVPSDGESGLCLITGEQATLALVNEPAIKGVIGAMVGGAKLVSCHLDAFTSYGKEQCLNSPVGEAAAFAYCNALNHLLASDRQRFRVGDTSTVFWTETPAPAEDLLPFLVDSGKTTEDEALKQRLAGVIERIAAGNLSGDDLGGNETRFYILGLAPNRARLSVRFWHTSTLGDLAANLQKHHHDLAIERQWDEMNSKHPEPKTPGLYALLKQTSRDADGIPPLLGGALMRAILLGTKYPDALFQKVMSRVRVAESDKNDNPVDRVGYLRASIIKAYLNRNHNQNLTMSLDTTRTDTAYLLGRLFAVLEKTQQDALPDINTTIRDRFYSAASATPGAVFSRILRTYQHWLGKLEGGHRVNRERLVQDIMSGMTSFPTHLNLQQQGQFAIGYYHQRKDFFTKKDKPETAQE